MIESGKPASSLAHVFDPYPQLLENIRFTDTDPLEAASVKSAIADGENAIRANGRLLIRKSGTEPLVRLMGECEDAGLLRRVVGDIATAVKAAA